MEVTEVFVSNSVAFLLYKRNELLDKNSFQRIEGSKWQCDVFRFFGRRKIDKASKTLFLRRKQLLK